MSQNWKNLEKLNIRELYKIQLSLKYEKPTCQAYHEKKFGNYNFDWKIIYGVPRFTTYDTKVFIFQYKLLSNVLYLNQKLYQFGIVSCSKCFFCDIHDEIPLHLFYECVSAQNIWNQLRLYLADKIDLPVLTPESVILGFVGRRLRSKLSLI